MCVAEEEREKRTKIFEEIMTEKFPQLLTDTKSQIQKAQRTPSRINTKETTAKHIIFKLQKMKGKQKLLKEAITGEKTLPNSNKEKNYVSLPQNLSKKGVERN